MDETKQVTKKKDLPKLGIWVVRQVKPKASKQKGKQPIHWN